MFMSFDFTFVEPSHSNIYTDIFMLVENLT